jgi:hypothetical protein
MLVLFIPEAQRNGISDANHFVMLDLIRHPEILGHVQLLECKLNGRFLFFLFLDSGSLTGMKRN